MSQTKRIHVTSKITYCIKIIKNNIFKGLKYQFYALLLFEFIFDFKNLNVHLNELFCYNI